MMVNYPLSRGLGSIAKVYLITCSQSTYAKLKKYEICPVGHGGIAHMQCVRCIMYIKNIYFAHKFYISKYNSLANVQRIDYAQYTIQNTHILYAVCEVFSVLAIHYTEYIMNV